MRKKRRVPVVLWRLFRDRARTLSNAIATLLPQTPSSFQCNGRLCLHCRGENAISHLLRPDDPAGYRKLLTQCFVVFDEKAPPIVDFRSDNRWSQHQIVRRTIEMIIMEQSNPSNVIISGYNKFNQSSPVVELLTSSDWSLLLKRVGDDLMIYLLKHSSIFLPLPRKKHHQVAGSPISNLVFKLSKQRAESWHLNQSVAQSGFKKKRDRDDKASSSWSSFSIEDSMGSSCFSCSSNSSIGPCRKHSAGKCSQVNLSEGSKSTSRTGDAKCEGYQNEALKSSNQIMVKSKKRSRPFRWQRYKKRMQLDFKETSDSFCYVKDFNGNSSLPRRLQPEFIDISRHNHEKMPEQCSCCLVLQAPCLNNQGAWIDRQSIFYNIEHSSSVLPRKYILSSLRPNFDGSKSLLGSIFGLSGVILNSSSILCAHSSLNGSVCLFHSLLKMLKVLIRRAQHCKHLRLLDKHCAVSSATQSTVQKSSLMFEGNDLEGEICNSFNDVNAEQCKEDPEIINSHIEAIKSYCSRDQVVSFIWAVCRTIVPPDLLGTPSNWRILRGNISKFIQLRRFEKFSLKQCMFKLKTSEFPFLSNNRFLCRVNAQMLNSLKHMLLGKWIFWFFSSLVVPLVQANFYVTESEHGKQNIYYYRKSTWKKLINGVITCLKDQNYQRLDAADVYSILDSRPFGFSKLRLRPKANGVRILTNLKASSRMPAPENYSDDLFTNMHRKGKFNSVKFRHFKSVNSVLRDIHAVLKGIQLKEPERLGSSVFDYNDIYKRLCPFIIGLKNGLTTMPSLYIVASDVSKAFDSIDQDKLLSVMKDVFCNDEYLLKQSYEVRHIKKSLWAHENLVLTDPNISTAFATSSHFGSLHTVLVNQGCNRYLRKEDILFLLNEHVKRNVLLLDKKFYLQGLGIPQGSILSSLLCSLYYGHLERNVVFPFLEKNRKLAMEELSRRHNSQDSSTAGNVSDNEVITYPHYLLLRLIDDFLFISTSKKQAAGFFSMFHRGFRAYNCYMNEEKFSLSFNIGHVTGLQSNRVYIGEDGILFIRWSGLFLNSSTLEVQADYMRYLNNHLSSTLTICWQGKPSHHLKMKLCSFTRPKCHPIFFDSNINSAPIVRLNIYQVFLLCAMKFHCYVSDMSYICKLRPRSYLKIIERSLRDDMLNEGYENILRIYHFTVIHHVISRGLNACTSRYMFLLIRKRMHSVCLGPGFRPVLQLEEEEVEWLGLNAYIQVLKKKQSRHKVLLSLLRLKLSAHRIGAVPSSQLKYAVDPSHSSLVWKISY